MTLKTYDPSMHSDVEAFYIECFHALGWEYEPEGRHRDTVNIAEIYQTNGEFWCLYDGGAIIGTVAVHVIDIAGNV
jgi:hypothetical protein